MKLVTCAMEFSPSCKSSDRTDIRLAMAIGSDSKMILKNVYNCFDYELYWVKNNILSLLEVWALEHWKGALQALRNTPVLGFWPVKTTEAWWKPLLWQSNCLIIKKFLDEKNQVL